MRVYVAVTDKDWFALHASKAEVEEVNFWRPSPDAAFKALQPGELLLFKLHSPDNFITGGGFFTRFLQLPGLGSLNHWQVWEPLLTSRQTSSRLSLTAALIFYPSLTEAQSEFR